MKKFPVAVQKRIDAIAESRSLGRLPLAQWFKEGSIFDLVEFHDVFIEQQDMTEYKAAIALMGTWENWQKMKQDYPTFCEHILLWKDELEVKLQSEALQKILALRHSESDAQALAANKFISEAGWNKRAGRGRPSNAEKKRAEREIATAAQITKEERERVFKVINFDRS